MLRRRPPTTPLTPDEALRKLETFCAYRDRTGAEVRARLAELGVGGETAEEIFGLLRDEGFFDETRFARAYVRGKLNSNHWGRVRIRIELKRKGIDPDTIRQVMAEEIDETEYTALAQRLIEKKRLSYQADDPLAAQKAAASLIRAGFEPELVFRLI